MSLYGKYYLKDCFFKHLLGIFSIFQVIKFYWLDHNFSTIECSIIYLINPLHLDVEAA